MATTSVYQFMVANASALISSPENLSKVARLDPTAHNAFTLSEIMGKLLLKPAGDILVDILNAYEKARPTN